MTTTTETVTLTLGVTSGYGHDNEGSSADEAGTLKAGIEAAIAAAGKVQEETGIYPSFVGRPARCGYSHDWGCPQGGEFVLVLSGTRNPEFCQNSEDYLAAWQRLAELLQEEFDQTTATLEVVETKLAYLKRTR